MQIAAVNGSGPLEVPIRARWATWGPTGTTIAYIAQGATAGPDQAGLYSASSPDQPARRLQSGKFQVPSLMAHDRLPT